MVVINDEQYARWDDSRATAAAEDFLKKLNADCPTAIPVDRSLTKIQLILTGISKQ